MNTEIKDYQLGLLDDILLGTEDDLAILAATKLRKSILSAAAAASWAAAMDTSTPPLTVPTVPNLPPIERSKPKKVRSRDVKCPACDAKPGKDCVRVVGKRKGEGMGGDYHIKRADAAGQTGTRSSRKPVQS